MPQKDQGVARQFARRRGFLQLRLALGERRLRLASPALQYVLGGALAAFLPTEAAAPMSGSVVYADNGFHTTA